jgi:hypothetical protein
MRLAAPMDLGEEEGGRHQAMNDEEGLARQRPIDAGKKCARWRRFYFSGCNMPKQTEF